VSGLSHLFDRQAASCNMSAELLNPSVCQEDALNALIEIRACHDELQTFLSSTFDRLDELVDRLRIEHASQRRAKRQMEPGSLHDQIGLLARIAAELAESVGDGEGQTDEQDGAESPEAEA
jgi:hypothetical protein